MYIYIYCQLRAEDNPLPIGGCRIESQDSQYPETCCGGKISPKMEKTFWEVEDSLTTPQM